MPRPASRDVDQTAIRAAPAFRAVVYSLRERGIEPEPHDYLNVLRQMRKQGLVVICPENVGSPTLGRIVCLFQERYA